MDTTISQKLKDFIEVSGLSEECIASMSGMSQSSINMIKNDNYPGKPVRIMYFFNSGMDELIMGLHRELKELGVDDYVIVPDSIAIKRMKKHKQLSKLINKEMPKVSKQAASLSIK